MWAATLNGEGNFRPEERTDNNEKQEATINIEGKALTQTKYHLPRNLHPFPR